MDIENDLLKIQDLILKIQKKLNIKNTNSKYQHFEELKDFFFDNFELTNNRKDYILLNELTRFIIKHFDKEVSIKNLHLMLNQIIKTETKRLGNKTFKAKIGLKTKKLEFEFSNVRSV
jgi:hypothetical protein